MTFKGKGVINTAQEQREKDGKQTKDLISRRSLVTLASAASVL